MQKGINKDSEFIATIMEKYKFQDDASIQPKLREKQSDFEEKLNEQVAIQNQSAELLSELSTQETKLSSFWNTFLSFFIRRISVEKKHLRNVSQNPR